jgi:hypothetical protein
VDVVTSNGLSPYIGPGILKEIEYVPGFVIPEGNLQSHEGSHA